MDVFQTAGWCAAILSSISMLPQVLKGFRTRSVRDLSVVMLFIMIAAAVCWLTYGIYRNDWVIITTNICALVFLTILCVQKVVFRNQVQQHNSI